jgi:hypothetical protein
MENVIETNGEPVTIKITIEIIPGKKKEETPIIPSTPEGWKEVEPTPVIKPTPITESEEPEMVFEPMTTPAPPLSEKKKRAYTRKPKEVAPVEIVEEKPVVTTIPSETQTITPRVVPVVATNKVTARLAQMIRFYCKASGIETSTITIAHLKEKAFDIVENVSDDVINEAIKEASGK